MTLALLALVVPGVLPAVATGGRSATTVFFAPLWGALIAGVAAVLEFGLAGSLLDWWVAGAIVANVASGAVLVAPVAASRRRRRARRRATPAPEPWPWAVASALVLVAALAWPLRIIGPAYIGFDTHAIWLVHAAAVSAGHPTMFRMLTDRAYTFANPDYPPLLPAADALAYAVNGHVAPRLAVIVTTVLNAGAVGAVASGLWRVVPRAASRARRLVALVLCAGFADAAFGVAGDFAFNGYADLMWSATALGAVVYGLVLPRSRRSVAMAWVCLAIAVLTKNEGFLVGVVVAGLIVLRHRRRDGPASGRLPLLDAVVRLAGGPGGAVFAAVAVAPGVAWAALVRLDGISSDFFTHGVAHEGLGMRLRFTAPAMASHLALLLVAAGAAVVGGTALASRRRALRLGSPGWLWAALTWSLLAIGATYVFGSLEIHWWLASSANRTTIFAQLSALAEVTGWGLVAVAAWAPIQVGAERPAVVAGVAGLAP